MSKGDATQHSASHRAPSPVVDPSSASVVGAAPGKVILLGEHAVVYGHPALAVPVCDVEMRVRLTVQPGGALWDVRELAEVRGLPPGILARFAEIFGLERIPALHVEIDSTIPIAGGLGSSAALGAAACRAMAHLLGRQLTDQQVADLVFEGEKLFHRTPSGIDNTVVAYAKPILFTKGQPARFLTPGAPFDLVIVNSGHGSLTGEAIQAVRSRMESDPEGYTSLFDRIAVGVEVGAAAFVEGDLAELGRRMTANHQSLQALGVSSPGLDAICEAGLSLGALGAKLTGAGRGGNAILLAPAGSGAGLKEALQARLPHLAAPLVTRIGG